MPPLRAVRACPDPFRQSFPLESCFSGGLFPSRCSCALLQHTKQRRNTAFRRWTLDLFQSPTNSWREGLLEPAGTCSFEKTTFSRRWSRPPSRRWHFLEEGRVLLRENAIFPKMAARFFDKVTFSRGWSRPPSRRSRFLEDRRVLLREDRIFSKIVVSSFEKMTFSPRWLSASSKRSRLLEDGHVLRREDRVFPKVATFFFEKIAFSRGWSCAGSISRVPKMGRFSFLGHFP